MQLANTPPLQSTTSGLHPVSRRLHQCKHPITAYYSVYRPRKDERLSRPAWLVNVWIIVYCFVFCLFIRLQISSARIKLATSNFAWRFICVLRRVPFWWTLQLCSPEAQNRTNRPYPRGSKVQGGKSYRNRHATDAPFVKFASYERRSAIGMSQKTDVLVLYVSSAYLTKNHVCILDQESYCIHDIFSKIRTAHLVISTTHFVLQNTLF